MTTSNKMQKKKKNTYVIDCSNFDYLIFSEQPTTPLIVLEKNGKPISSPDESKITPSIPFPNPCAYEMTSKYKEFKPIMGKLAQTIVEYLDKDTNESIAILFPSNEIMYRKDYPDFKKRLNHASRQDLKKQLEIRQNFLEKLKQNQK